jgi:DNA-directed RNA polymerase subunit K/omega
MFKVSTEEIIKTFENRYEAVVVLAKEARRVNLFASEEISESGEKPILRAITKLNESGIEFTYEVPLEEETEENEAKEKKKE